MDFIFEQLDMPPGIVWITGLHLEDWGRRLVLDCLYGDAVGFRLRFDDCRELKWRVYVHAEESQRAQLGEARFGRGGHRVAAQLLTDFFGISVLYDSLTVELSETQS